MNSPVLRFGDDHSGTFRSVAFNGETLVAATAESGLEAYDYKTGRSLFNNKSSMISQFFLMTKNDWNRQVSFMLLSLIGMENYLLGIKT